MSPITHLLISWGFAEITTQKQRDRDLITWAGALPDLDGLGVLIDIPCNFFGFSSFMLYHRFHHILLHGLFGSIVITLILSIWAKGKCHFFIIAFLCIHLHLICDLVGSRGPTASDIWPIYYFEPFSNLWTLSWSGQWELNAWQNLTIACLILGFMLVNSIRNGRSIVYLFSEKAETVFIKTVQQRWRKIKIR